MQTSVFERDDLSPPCVGSTFHQEAVKQQKEVEAEATLGLLAARRGSYCCKYIQTAGTDGVKLCCAAPSSCGPVVLQQLLGGAASTEEARESLLSTDGHGRSSSRNKATDISRSV
ncbi:hypothetical protein EXN66_Car021774 [Channa argus]|uniref:Uncharacterized protein n=1 Tax=Channa argus TaxID=215402 RepID=A0A6G1QUV2_CHAAH|nr:hypothetical protein EXN66_Car021774 [Channa argus]